MIHIIDNFYFEYDTKELQYDLFAGDEDTKDYIASFSDLVDLLGAVTDLKTKDESEWTGAVEIGDYLAVMDGVKDDIHNKIIETAF